MTTAMKNALSTEIEFIDSLLEYENLDELTILYSIEEASEESIALVSNYGTDFPEGLANPETMLMVWNYCLTEAKANRKKAERANREREIMAAHPEWLTYTGYYNDPEEIAFIDPDDLAHLLQYRGSYDAAHVKIVLDAIKAWADRK